MEEETSRDYFAAAEKRGSVDGFPARPLNKILRPKHAEAWRDGFRFLAEAEGAYNAERARGYAEGREAGQAEAARIIAEAAVKMDRYLSSLEPDIARLAFDIVRRVLGEFDVGALTERAAVHAIADFREEKALKITVHPSNLVRVRAAVASYIRQANLSLRAVVEEDASLPAGGCTVASEFAVADASIEAQLDALARGFGIAP